MSPIFSCFGKLSCFWSLWEKRTIKFHIPTNKMFQHLQVSCRTTWMKHVSYKFSQNTVEPLFKQNLFKSVSTKQRFDQDWYKKLQPFSKNFSRTTLDFQGPPTRNVISQIVQKCLFPVHSNKTLRLELFAPPTSLHFSVHLS